MATTPMLTQMQFFSAVHLQSAPALADRMDEVVAEIETSPTDEAFAQAASGYVVDLAMMRLLSLEGNAGAVDPLVSQFEALPKIVSTSGTTREDVMAEFSALAELVRSSGDAFVAGVRVA